MSAPAVDDFLRLESQQFQQEEEVKRILKLVALKNKDPFLTLEMPTDCYISLTFPEKIVKKQFRVKSLLLHPDKNKHEQAREVFDYLQGAVNEINDPDKFRIIKNYLKDARDNVFYNMGLKRVGSNEKVDTAQLIEKSPKLGISVF
jgi:DnaJ homolog subfamily C member 8